jgi:hypothetical protein
MTYENFRSKPGNKANKLQKSNNLLVNLAAFGKKV